MLENGANINAENKNKETPLFSSIRKGKLCGVVDTDNLQNLSNHSNSSGKEKLVELLLQNGANINIVNKNKHSPLQLAIQYGSVKVVDVLLKHGADRYIENNLEASLEVGSQKGKKELFEMIVSLIEIGYILTIFGARFEFLHSI